MRTGKLSGDALSFAVENIDNLICEAQAAIPFDSPLANKDWIKKEIDNGNLTCITLRLNGKPIGTMTYAVIEANKRELLISSLHVNDTTFDYCKVMQNYGELIAKENKCDSMRFHTVRKGLIYKALKLGWHASEIVMRCPIKH
jgi:hypothetical protein